MRYKVQIEIENHSDSMAGLVLMTCSWDKNIIINTPLVVYSDIECNSNFPHHVEIKPHGKYSLIADLQKNKGISECQTCPMYIDTVTLRMGLILIQNSNDYDRIMNDKSSWNIIWSNSIKLNKNIKTSESD